ncbi:MAG: T9SS type A sorting domain-containing protein [Saprospiraceae bacterium]|nr:T9SS type A sorting domain-containing protein [Saprospiraceae bacterium]
MKTLSTLVILFAFSLSPAFGQCQIPNGSFEEWIDLTDSIERELALELLHPVEVPQGYFPLTRLVEIALSDFITDYFDRDTLDLPIFQSLQRYEPGANGTASALRMAGDSLVAVSDLLQIFECGDRSASLTGYYKYHGSDPDSLMIVALLHDSDIKQEDEAFAAAVFTTEGGPSEYTKFEAPFAYRSNEVPDSASILIFTFRDDSATTDTSFFVIDELKIEGGSVPVREVVERNDFLIHPNPVSEVAQINAPHWQRASLQIFNANGMLMQSLEDVRHGQRLFLHSLPAGLYLMSAHDGDRRYIQKFVVQ